MNPTVLLALAGAGAVLLLSRKGGAQTPASDGPSGPIGRVGRGDQTTLDPGLRGLVSETATADPEASAEAITDAASGADSEQNRVVAAFASGPARNMATEQQVRDYLRELRLFAEDLAYVPPRDFGQASAPEGVLTPDNMVAVQRGLNQLETLIRNYATGQTALLESLTSSRAAIALLNTTGVSAELRGYTNLLSKIHDVIWPLSRQPYSIYIAPPCFDERNLVPSRQMTGAGLSSQDVLVNESNREINIRLYDVRAGRLLGAVAEDGRSGPCTTHAMRIAIALLAGIGRPDLAANLTGVDPTSGQYVRPNPGAAISALSGTSTEAIILRNGLLFAVNDLREQRAIYRVRSEQKG